MVPDHVAFVELVGADTRCDDVVVPFYEAQASFRPSTPLLRGSVYEYYLLRGLVIIVTVHINYRVSI